MLQQGAQTVPLPDPQDVLRWAETYRQMGFIPLATYLPLGFTENGTPVCSCFRGADCKNPGKHPIGKYAEIDTPDQGYQQVWHALATEQAKGLSVNLAVRTGPMSGIFVVDLDIKEGQNGVAQFERWLATHGYTLEQLDYTMIAKSGGGGLHYVFRHPEGIELNPKNSGEEFGKGIDIKSGGMPFHVQPSIHKNGGQYEWKNYVMPGDAPEVIYRTAQKKQAASVDIDEEYTPSLTELKEYADELAASRKELKKSVGINMRDALNGQVIAQNGGGHDAFRDVAFFMFKRWPTAHPAGLCNYLTSAIQARLDFMPDSGTSHEDVLHSFHTARGKIDEQRSNWTGQLLLNDQGSPLATSPNILLYFRNHPAWKGVLGYNLRRNRPVYLRRPPLDKDTPAGNIESSQDATFIGLWFQTKARMAGKISERDLQSALLAAAWENQFDPLQDMINNLRGSWDGHQRLPTVLQRVAGTPDSEWVRTVFPLWMKSLVARILKPGCKADSMLIIEGPQGYKKSTFFSSLLPDNLYFSDSLSKVRHDVESIRLVHSGPAIFELGELSGLRKQEVEEIKAFLSAFQDDLRPLYEPPRTTPRRAIFVGTTNRDDYLRDETGGRRFWPVKATREIDIDTVLEERDQWFAEALAGLDRGEPWWLTSGRASALAQTEQDARYEEDIWEQPVAEWLADRLEPSTTEADPTTATAQMQSEMNKQKAGDYVLTIDVAKYALKMEIKNARNSEGARINKILRRLGWVPERFEDSDGKRKRGWRRPFDLKT
jgi:predicted P-loop ATPase